MNGIVIVLIAMAALSAAYALYGRWLARKWGIDPKKKTPAYEFEDGKDYVPTTKLAVFTHQFSSIAGAGPVTGPILAAVFGWVPVLLWILIGGIFFGAVQDFGALYASVKNDGKSIGVIIEKYIGKTGKRLFLIFSWLFTLLVIAAFSDMVANTFNGFTAEGVAIFPNAAAASISALFTFGAIGFGFYIKKKHPSAKIEFLIGFVLLVVLMAAGIAFPMYFSKGTWIALIFLYIFFASILPMWMLMQPRDIMSSFLLIGMIGAAVIGVFLSNPDMNLNAFNGFTLPNGAQLFPTLFITIACGAVSGFHSLVSSGTSSKTISNEKDMLMVGYGAMMCESLLAVVALVIVGGAVIGGVMPEGTPFQIFSGSVANSLASLGLPLDIAQCIMTMCVATLALTSLDSVSRIGKMCFQELFTPGEGEKSTSFTKLMTNPIFATLATLFAGYLLSRGGYNNVWILFGSANQLLAALVLITLSVFLKITGRKGWMLYVPMTVMFLATMTALVQRIMVIVKILTTGGNFSFLTEGLQLVVALALVALAAMVAFNSIGRLISVKVEVDSNSAQ